jgi:hypothetical protein
MRMVHTSRKLQGLASFCELTARKLEECMDWDDDED